MKKQIKNISILIILLSVLSFIFLMLKPKKPEIKIIDHEIEIKAYTLLDVESLFENIDESQSTYDSLDLLYHIDNSSYNIETDIEMIYEYFDLELSDKNKLPIGQKGSIEYIATIDNRIAKDQLTFDIEYNPIIKYIGPDNKPLESDETFPLGTKIEDILDIKIIEERFGNKSISLEPHFNHNINPQKEGSYSVVITNDRLSISKNLEVFIDAKDLQTGSTSQSNQTTPVTTDINDPSILINKEYTLAKTDIPYLKTIDPNYAVDEGYRAQPQAIDNFYILVDTMQKETNMTILVTSSYRSYRSQERLFNNYVQQHGIKQANVLAARPGQSEHQTGLALDVIKPGVSMFDFGSTQEAIWLEENAHRFGFIIRYPKEKEAITQYQYEPWHLRYLGHNLAQKVYDSGLSYEEYWSIHLEN